MPLGPLRASRAPSTFLKEVLATAGQSGVRPLRSRELPVVQVTAHTDTDLSLFEQSTSHIPSGSSAHLRLYATRAFSASTCASRSLPFLLDFRPNHTSPRSATAAAPHRSLSLASRVRLPFLRDKATTSPSSLEAQHRLFVELSSPDAGAKEHEELIGRYEELSQIGHAQVTEPEHPVLKDDASFALYLRALAARAATAEDPATFFNKLNEAPVKRAALLSPASSVAPAPSTSTAATADPHLATTPQPTSAPTPSAPSLTPAALVTALFSGPAGRGKGGDAKITSSGAWASSGGVAGAGEPIRVLVEEAKSPLPMRALKFVFVTLLYSFLL